MPREQINYPTGQAAVAVHVSWSNDPSRPADAQYAQVGLDVPRAWLKEIAAETGHADDARVTLYSDVLDAAAADKLKRVARRVVRVLGRV